MVNRLSISYLAVRLVLLGTIAIGAGTRAVDASGIMVSVTAARSAVAGNVPPTGLRTGHAAADISQERPQVTWAAGGHASAILGVSYSPDGALAASVAGGKDCTIKIWGTSDGQLRHTLVGHDGAVLSVAFSPDGRTLASGGSDGAVRLWRTSDGTPIRTLPAARRSVLCVAFSPDGAVVAAGTWDREVKLWSSSDGSLLRTLEDYKDPVFCIAFSPDGSKVATGSGGGEDVNDNTVAVWRVADGKLVQKLAGHERSVRSLAYSPDGKTIASGSGDHTIRLWRAVDGVYLRSLAGHPDTVASVSFSPDSTMLASSCSFDPSSKFGSYPIIVWNTATGSVVRRIAGVSGTTASVAFSHDGTAVLAGGVDRHLREWRVSDGLLLRTYTAHRAIVRCMAFDPSGGLLVVGSGGDFVIGEDFGEGEVRIISAGGSLRLRLETSVGAIHAVSLAPRSGMVAAGSATGAVLVWRYTDGRMLWKLEKRDTSIVRAVAFSPDGDTLAVGGSEGSFWLHRVTDWQEINKITGHTGTIRALAYAPDRSLLASAGDDQVVKLWHASDGALVNVLAGHTGSIRSVTFSTDSTLIASASYDGTVKLWRASDGTLLSTLSGHQGGATGATFSRDGSAIASVSWEGSIQLWRVADGTRLHTFRDEGGRLTSVVFSPDGTELVYGRADATVLAMRNPLGGSPGPSPTVEADRPAVSYTVMQLGDIVGVSGVNEAGDVVGWRRAADPTDVPMIYTSGRATPLKQLGAPSDLAPNGIGDAGHIVGTTARDGVSRGYTWRAGTLTVLEPVLGLWLVSSTAVAVNASGQAVGTAAPASGDETRAVLWSGGNGRNLGLLPGARWSRASAINKNGKVVGVSGNWRNEGGDKRGQWMRPFIWWNGGMQTMDVASSVAESTTFPRAISDQDVIVGQAVFGAGAHAFRRVNGIMEDLGALPGHPISSAYAVNNAGLVVGSSTPASGNAMERAVAWGPDGTVDLTTRIPAGCGWELRSATGINCHGQIIGSGLYHGAPAAFLLTPATTARP